MNKKIKIIIADDNIEILNYLSIEISKDMDFDIIGKASNGVEIIDLFRKNGADVLVTDIDMPMLNGLQTIELLSMEYVKLPLFFVISGGQNKEIIDKLIRLNISKFYHKPINVKLLISEIKEIFYNKDVYVEKIEKKVKNKKSIKLYIRKVFGLNKKEKNN